jgi:hypothetical protein
MTVEIEQEPTTGKDAAAELDHPEEIANGSQLQPDGVASDAAPQPLVDEPIKPSTNSIYLYTVIAVGLGLLLGAVIAAIAWQRSSRHEAATLGPVTSSAEGLTGRLELKWEDKLNYHLVVEPGDPLRRAEFGLAVSNPPRPVSFDIQLKDSAGSTLCDRTIVLKFDPKQAAALNGGPLAATGSTGDASTDQIAQGFDIAQAEAQELKREYGQDIFQNDIGADGQSSSINSQGNLPCSKQAYEHTASWSFTSNFSTLEEQAALLKRQSDTTAAADTAAAQASAAAKAPAARKKAKQKAQPATEAFAIEGDDELVGYDSTRGIIETTTRKFLVVGKPIAADNSAAWQDIPADVHYKCDLNAMCSLRRKGAAMLYAQWKR